MHEEGPQSFWHREDELAMRNGVQELVPEPFTPDRQALGVTRRAEVACFATEGDEEFSTALIAADARKPTFEIPTGQKLFHGTARGVPQAAVLLLELLLVNQYQRIDAILHQLEER